MFGAFFLVLCYGAVTRLFDYDRMLAAELAFVCGLTTFLVYRRRGSIEFAASNLKVISHKGNIGKTGYIRMRGKGFPGWSCWGFGSMWSA